MRIVQSAKEFGKTRSLALMGLLLGLRLAIGFISDIQVTENLRISFTIFPTTVACMLFGPVPGAIMGAAADILGLILKPTGPYFFGYTLDAMVAGFIYGQSFYKRKKIGPIRVMVTLLLVAVVVNLGMNTSWICIQYGVKDIKIFFTDLPKAISMFSAKFKAIFMGRLIKNAVQYPVNVVGVFFILQGVRMVLKSLLPERASAMNNK